MDRDNKGKFIAGHNGYKYWSGKKRGEMPASTKAKISNSMVGLKRTPENRKNIADAKLGNKNPSYKNGRMVVGSGHILLIDRNHPNHNINGRVFEHRLVMEKKLGRYLEKNEVVHHIDGNPANNNISNLFLTTKSGNSVAHHSITKLLAYLLENKILKFNKINGVYEKYNK